MARYIDADELIKQMKDGKYVDRETSFQRGVNSAIDYWITEINHFPTADVVPKSEVEKIFEEFDKIMHGYRVDKLLAELGVHIVEHGESTPEQRIAELKKKYTEDKNG